jgi:hypothetical protein
MATRKSEEELNPYEFEEKARKFLSRKWGTKLQEREIQYPNGGEKSFDLVSEDPEKYVGDAKYLKNIPAPAAKFSGIAEFVWLLQKIKRAKHKFLVFGRHIEVPERWLKKWRSLVGDVEFYFLKDNELKEYNKKEGKFVLVKRIKKKN